MKDQPKPKATRKKKLPAEAATTAQDIAESTQTPSGVNSTTAKSEDTNGVDTTKKEEQQNVPNDLPNPMREFFANQFQGMVQPAKRPIQRNKPVYEERYQLVTNDGRNYTQAKVYVHAPTLQYPTSGIFFQLNNAKGSCFMRFESASQFQEFADFISRNTQAVATLAAELQTQEQVIAQQIEQTDKIMQALAQMNQNQQED